MHVLLLNALTVVVAPWQVEGFGSGEGQYGWAMALILQAEGIGFGAGQFGWAMALIHGGRSGHTVHHERSHKQ
jgi:hypothetical protein